MSTTHVKSGITTQPTTIERSVLTDIDHISQETYEAIQALVAGARKLLSANPASIAHVDALLRQISDQSLVVMNEINSVAERHGANFVGSH